MQKFNIVAVHLHEVTTKICACTVQKIMAFHVGGGGGGGEYFMRAGDEKLPFNK